ncbi:MAG: hypothetical protein ABIY51_16055 [Ferruginibacter sp.]
MKIKFIGGLIVFFIAACTSTGHLQPADADLAVARQRVPGITLSDLQKGYKIFATNCSACHRLHDPKEYTAKRWEPILVKMFDKAKMADINKRALVTNYIMAKSREDNSIAR